MFLQDVFQERQICKILHVIRVYTITLEWEGIIPVLPETTRESLTPVASRWCDQDHNLNSLSQILFPVYNIGVQN